LSKVRDSLPSKSSVDATKGDKCPHCSRQASRYFFFFSLSWASTYTLWGSLDLWDFVSTSVIRASMMQSFPRAQRPQTKMLSRSSVRLLWKRHLTAGLSAPQRDRYGLLVRCELWGGERPWKEGRSARLKSHCAVRLRDRHTYIQAHGER
jgi:hypothetical protein